MTDSNELLQELRDLHETALARPLPFPAEILAGEVGRALRDLDPARKVRDIFQAAIEEARAAKVALEDLTFLKRVVLRERVELRKLVRTILGVSETGTVNPSAGDDELVEGWKKHLLVEQGRTETTIGTYAKSIELFRRFLAPRAIRLKDVDRDDVLGYKEALIRAGNCALTVNGKLGALRSFYDYLAFTGDLERSPLKFVRWLKPERRRLPVLTVQELERFVAAIDPGTTRGLRDLALVILLCATGARLGEVLRLKVTDVDFGRGVVIYRTRKNHEDVEVVVTENAQAVLKQYIEKARPKLLRKVKSPEERERFILSSFGRPLHRGTISKSLVYYGKQAGIEKRISPHVFRRPIATTLANNGMPAEPLKVFLGHRSISTTLNHYVVYAAESQRRAVEDFHPLSFGKLLPKVPPPAAAK